MTDREVNLAAARAAHVKMDGVFWDPINNGNDSQFLMARLFISVRYGIGYVEAWLPQSVVPREGSGWVNAAWREVFGTNANSDEIAAATRRAIANVAIDIERAK